jgi:hypothetical protein
MAFWRTAATAALSCALSAGLASADVPLMTNVDEFVKFNNKHQGFPSQTFKTSDIVAPVYLVNELNPQVGDDAPFIFIANTYRKEFGSNHGGPMILNATDLSLIYADQKYPNSFHSLPQEIKGERYMTFWEGSHSRGHADGNCLIVNEKYELTWNITAIGRHGADMHECIVTKDGTVIVSVYWNIPYNCTDLGGPADCLILNSGFQEIDVENNELLFEWSAVDHFKPQDSFSVYNDQLDEETKSGWDWFHINSIEKDKDGNYMISSRNLHVISLVSKDDGKPIWTMGGRNNEFKDLSNGHALNFAWQHNPRFTNKEQNQITLFDNHVLDTGDCNPKHGCVTRAMQLQIDQQKKTARLANEWFHPQKINAGAMGGVQTLPSGNIMVGWGHAASITEFTQDGRVALDFSRSTIHHDNVPDMFMYRAYKGNWTGNPQWRPSIFVDAPKDDPEVDLEDVKNTTIYTSWNGATNVAQWAYFAADTPGEVESYDSFVGMAPKDGFETVASMDAASSKRYIAAAAVGHDGKVLHSTVIYDAHLRIPWNPGTDPKKMLLNPPGSAENQDIPERPDLGVGKPDVVTDKPDDTTDGSNGAPKEGLEKLKEPANAGAVAGGLLFVGGSTFALVWFCRRRRREANEEAAKYTPLDMEELGPSGESRS